jgi:ATP-binding protein involved in chromosome partitioning
MAFPALSQVKKIIAIASGKGGVGKSTVSTHLAVALRANGASVGLLDADIYGPSQTSMLGAKSGERPGMEGDLIQPLNRHGIRFISMGSLVPDDGPVVWRAPMATKMIHQFLGGVNWGALDYLLIDLPPGTGDVQLTLAQQASLHGAVIVTTPQDVALGIAKRAFGCSSSSMSRSLGSWRI